MGSGPSQGFTPDQIQAINAAPYSGQDAAFGNPRGPGISSWWGGQGVGGPAGNLSGFGGFNPQPPQASIWDKLTNALGQVNLPKTQMPGTTIGAPAGQPAPGQPPPFVPQGPMPRPPGMGAYFQALQNPPAGGGGGLMAQYMALQQLMRGG